MKSQMKMVAAAILAASLVVSYAYAGAPPPPPQEETRQLRKPPKPTVEDQINALRQEFQSQIDSLKTDLAAKDAQLKQAQQAAADAQAAAQKAQADATAQQQALTENAAAVSTLQSTVTDMKARMPRWLLVLRRDHAQSRRRSQALTPFTTRASRSRPPAASWRLKQCGVSGATGGDINTPFTGIPLDNSEAAQIERVVRLRPSVARGPQGRRQARQHDHDRLLRGGLAERRRHFEQQPVQQLHHASAPTVGRRQDSQDGWDFSGGQGWSLATETTQGLTRGTEILPSTIDAQYDAGFVWARQYSFRVSKDFGKKFFLGIRLRMPKR